VTRYLLDTNVVSELRRSRPSPAVVGWFDGLGSAELLLSVLTIGELRAGVERLARRDPVQAARIDAWVEDLVQRYSGAILPVDTAVARQWGELSAVRPLPVVDALLAATALVSGAVLVTRNTRDLAGLGVPMIDPFAGPTEAG